MCVIFLDAGQARRKKSSESRSKKFSKINIDRHKIVEYFEMILYSYLKPGDVKHPRRPLDINFELISISVEMC